MPSISPPHSLILLKCSSLFQRSRSKKRYKNFFLINHLPTTSVLMRKQLETWEIESGFHLLCEKTIMKQNTCSTSSRAMEKFWSTSNVAVASVFYKIAYFVIEKWVLGGAYTLSPVKIVLHYLLHSVAHEKKNYFEFWLAIKKTHDIHVNLCASSPLNLYWNLGAKILLNL